MFTNKPFLNPIAFKYDIFNFRAPIIHCYKIFLSTYFQVWSVQEHCPVRWRHVGQVPERSLPQGRRRRVSRDGRRVQRQLDANIHLSQKQNQVKAKFTEFRRDINNETPNNWFSKKADSLVPDIQIGKKADICSVKNEYPTSISLVVPYLFCMQS